MAEAAAGALPSAVEVADRVRRGDLSAVRTVEHALAAIEARNGRLNAFVHLDRDGALREAEALDRRIARGEDPGPLAGVAFGVKDHEDCRGMPTSEGSLLRAGRGPAAADSLHVARLRAAGAVPVGKTALPEFGIGGSTSLAFGTTRNPWAPSRTTGGSSAGSAAAVAGGLVPFCTSADYGGSTRIPAAWTGTVGLKPMPGRIPDACYPSELGGTPGVITTTIADTARCLDVAAGPDDRDPLSLPPPGLRYERAIEELDVRGLRLFWSADLGFAVVEPQVARLAREAAEALAVGAELEWVTVAFTPPAPFRAWMRLAIAERLGDLEAAGLWPGAAERLTPVVRDLMTAGGRYRARHLAEARADIHRLREAVAALFEEVDVLATPAVAAPPFAAEEPPPRIVDGRDAGAVGGTTPFAMLANLAWLPAVSVPAGLWDGRYPVGLQLVGRRHAEAALLRLARLLERARPWPRHAPGVEA